MHYKNISTLIFDFGGVLINLDKDHCIKSFEQIGIKNIEIGQYKQSGFFLDFEKGLISADEFRNEIRKLSDKKIGDEEIDQAWCAFLQEIPESKLRLLLKLKERFRILMLSNTNEIHIDFCKKHRFNYENHSIDDFFEHCYFSYEMQMAKPDEEIFQTVLKKEKIAASNCLFLDDSIANIESAKKAGFQTYWVQKEDNLEFLLQIDSDK